MKKFGKEDEDEGEVRMKLMEREREREGVGGEVGDPGCRGPTTLIYWTNPAKAQAHHLTAPTDGAEQPR